jgi:hypothetical protein
VEITDMALVARAEGGEPGPIRGFACNLVTVDGDRFETSLTELGQKVRIRVSLSAGLTTAEILEYGHQHDADNDAENLGCCQIIH